MTIQAVLSGEKRWTVVQGDALEQLKTLPDECIDAVVTDPPAGIGFMGKEWDSPRGGRVPWIEWLTEILKEALRVLKPGGHALVWALPRTSHWTGTAIEQAGFEIRDCIQHLVGSGFPKSLNVSKAIDAAAGVERETVGSKRLGGNACIPCKDKGGTYGVGVGTAPAQDVPITAPATDAAKQWDGWGTALKPGHECWWLARKPLNGTVAQNVCTHGTGGLNIAATRVGVSQQTSIQEREVGDSASCDTRASSRRASFAAPSSEHGHALCGARCIDAAPRSCSTDDTIRAHDAGAPDDNARPVARVGGNPSSHSRANVAACDPSSTSIQDSGSDYPACSRCGGAPLPAGQANVPDAVPSQRGAPCGSIQHQPGSSHIQSCQHIDHPSNLGDLYPVLPCSDGSTYSAPRQLDPANIAGRWPPNVALTHDAGCRRVGTRNAKGTNKPGPGCSPDARQWSDDGGWKPRPAHTFADANGRESVPLYECAPGCPVAELARQSGERVSGSRAAGVRSSLGYNRAQGDGGPAIEGSVGDASRFFPQFEWTELDFWPFLYCAKASRAERERGCEELPAHTAGEATGGRQEDSAGLKSPRAGSGRTGGADGMGVHNAHPT